MSDMALLFCAQLPVVPLPLLSACERLTPESNFFRMLLLQDLIAELSSDVCSYFALDFTPTRTHTHTHVYVNAHVLSKRSQRPKAMAYIHTYYTLPNGANGIKRHGNVVIIQAYIQTHSDTFKQIQTHSDTFKQIQTHMRRYLHITLITCVV